MTMLFDPEISADEFRESRVTIIGLGGPHTGPMPVPRLIAPRQSMIS